jgi:5-bromo-4-chloroindolyl phosphate hydrolysis protein
MANSLVSKAAALGGAACVFIGGMAALPTGFIGDILISAPLALLTGSGIWYFWPGRKPVTADDIRALHKHIDDIAAGTSGVDTKLVVEAIKMGSDKLDRILMEAAQIKSPNTVRRIKHIDAIGRKIIEDFHVDPKDVVLAQSWLNSYLDETITLVKGYAHLSRTGSRSLEAQKQMAKFDEMLDTIEINFQKLLDKLLSNDVMDFDVNMTVMNNRLQNEGI